MSKIRSFLFNKKSDTIDRTKKANEGAMGYLVISRRTNERISIGDDIEILIAGIGPDKVDVAIIAPKHKKILRKKTHLQENDGPNFRDKSRSGYKAS